ncbi:MAG: hypothetical protein AAGC64_09395 [Bacteroidota bacterium]
MENIPSYVEWTFVSIVVSVLIFMFYALRAACPARKNLSLLIAILISWIFLVSIQATFGFFEDFSFPPRLMIYVGIPVISTVILLLTPRTRKFLNEMPITTLHYIHIIRVPVEMVLWWLSVFRVLPKELTFEGSNLDIISGISAPFAAVFLVGKQSENRIGALLWNLLALGLLLNIVFSAISFTPYFYEASQNVPANTGLFYFPYILLPTFIVPVVLFSHLVALNQLIFKKNQSQF